MRVPVKLDRWVDPCNGVRCRAQYRANLTAHRLFFLRSLVSRRNDNFALLVYCLALTCSFNNNQIIKFHSKYQTNDYYVISYGTKQV